MLNKLKNNLKHFYQRAEESDTSADNTTDHQQLKGENKIEHFYQPAEESDTSADNTTDHQQLKGENKIDSNALLGNKIDSKIKAIELAVNTNTNVKKSAANTKSPSSLQSLVKYKKHQPLEVYINSIQSVRDLHSKQYGIVYEDLPLKAYSHWEDSTEEGNNEGCYSAIQRWARNGNKNNEFCFGVSKGSKGKSGEGLTHFIRCQCFKKQCEWSIVCDKIETSDHGIAWIPRGLTTKSLKFAEKTGIFDARMIHNHRLASTVGEKLANSSIRSMSVEVANYADMLVNTHELSMAQVYRATVNFAKSNGVQQPLFTLKDLSNKYRGKFSNNFLDCTNLLRSLMKREAEHGLFYDFMVDEEDGSLKNLFIEMESGKNILKEQDTTTVIRFDTKFGTNRYKLKLGVFCTIDKEGITRIVAISFQMNEDEDSFKWIFSKFKECFNVIPNIFWSDEDAAIGSAVRIEFPETKHNLCVWHIYKKFYKNLSPIFMENSEIWNQVQSLFWVCAKTSDLSFHDCLGSKLEAIRECILKNGNKEALRRNDRQRWLNNLVDKKEKWTAVHVCKDLNFGIASTQRVEAMNSAIAQFCKKKMNIQDIYDRMTLLSEVHEMKSLIIEERNLAKNIIGNNQVPPMIKVSCNQISFYDLY